MDSVRVFMLLNNLIKEIIMSNTDTELRLYIVLFT